MVFTLDDLLIDNILFAMENQNGTFLVDAENHSVVEEGAVSAAEPCRSTEVKSSDFRQAQGPNVERYYEIPLWTSGDGYEMLENFVGTLHNPICYAELRKVLTSGRGVFRGFKDVLKAYPEVEKKFNLYKEKVMKQKIISWYNNLREVWDLEKLPEEDEANTEKDLVREDFEFSDFDMARDLKSVLDGEKFLLQEKEAEYQGEALDAVKEIFFRECNHDTDELTGIVCKTLSGDFSGCILTVPCPQKAKFTVLMTDFFVLQNYRGLGIGGELLDCCLEKLRDRGVKRVFIPYQIIPQSIVPVLEQRGFESTHFGFAANLF